MGNFWSCMQIYCSLDVEKCKGHCNYILYSTLFYYSGLLNHIPLCQAMESFLTVC